MGSVYSALSAPLWGKPGESTPLRALEVGAGAAVVGGALGLAAAGAARLRQHRSEHISDGAASTPSIRRAAPKDG